MLISIQILFVRIFLLFIRFYINRNTSDQNDRREWIKEAIALELELDRIKTELKM